MVSECLTVKGQLPRPVTVHAALAASGAAQCGDPSPHTARRYAMPPDTLDPTTTTSKAARTRKPRRSRVRAMSVQYDRAVHGQPRPLSAHDPGKVSAPTAVTKSVPKLMTG